ncbi:MAG: folate hydrolase, partial [Acidobacteriota bacterium]
MRQTFLRFSVVFLLTFSVFAQTMPNEKVLMGFSAKNSAKQKALEAKFDSLLKAENLRTWMKRLSARPHHVGSPYDKENADFIAAQFKSWGFDVNIEQFEVLFPTPKTRLLEMTAPEQFTAKLEEPDLKEDATSNQKNEQLPTYNAYSADGDVT